MNELFGLTQPPKKPEAPKPPTIDVLVPGKYQICFYGWKPILLAVALIGVSLLCGAWMLATHRYGLAFVPLAVIACSSLIFLDIATLKWSYSFSERKIELLSMEGGAVSGDRTLADWSTDMLQVVDEAHWMELPALLLTFKRRGVRKTLLLAFAENDRAVLDEKIAPLLKAIAAKNAG